MQFINDHFCKFHTLYFFTGDIYQYILCLSVSLSLSLSLSELFATDTSDILMRIPFLTKFTWFLRVNLSVLHLFVITKLPSKRNRIIFYFQMTTETNYLLPQIKIPLALVCQYEMENSWRLMDIDATIEYLLISIKHDRCKVCIYLAFTVHGDPKCYSTLTLEQTSFVFYT